MNSPIEYLKKYKIIWLTGSNFIDVDMPTLPYLSQRFRIVWYVILEKDSFFTEQELSTFITTHNINGIVIKNSKRRKSFSSLKNYFNLVSCLRKENADLYYINYLGIPYLWPMLLLSSIKKDRIIYACHDYIEHKGVKNQTLYTFTKKFIFKYIDKIQFFSKSQEKYFRTAYPNKHTFYAPLALKNYGTSIENPIHNSNVFLFFGSIRENKGLDILIDASNKLYKLVGATFLVRIYGYSDNFEIYENRILNKECFDFKIRRIENNEIPKIFSTSNYLVLPYRDVTQSGVLQVSYNYYTPVIATNLPGFQEFIDDNVNGFLFEEENSESLFRIMHNIVSGKVDNKRIKDNLKTYVDDQFSINTIIDRYEKAFYLYL